MSRYTSGRFGAVSLLALPVLGLEFAAWVILLAGVSALQQRCNGNGEIINGDAPVGNIFPANVCRNVYRFQWWTVILQLVVILGVLVSIALSWVPHHRIALTSLLSIVTVLLMLDTNTFLYVHDAITHGSLWKRSNTYFAGAILSSIFNFLLIILLGHSGEAYAGAARGPHTGTAAATGAAPAHATPVGHNKGPTGTTTAAEPAPATV